ncbi:hypothetical protein PIB30_034782 [Stylosanthes scabra]|uniref:RNase H type-1 domain-containing protein n=1 Tax=Stylosanthes scabra TaxID=79078 RepID=A0ABU6RDH9_9FABA|nr:hypothetical protein [Stylosanthes scabra]
MFCQDAGMGAIVAVFRDREGKLTKASTSKIQANSALIVEANAVREALILANQMRIDKLIIETDCQVLYQHGRKIGKSSALSSHSKLLELSRRTHSARCRHVPPPRQSFVLPVPLKAVDEMTTSLWFSGRRFSTRIASRHGRGLNQIRVA